MRFLARFILILFSISLLQLSAQPSDNPPLKGFNISESSPQAIVLADRVMQKLGGRTNWDNTRHIAWRFFGRRLHIWDKWTGELRFEDNDLIVLMNINTKEGRAWIAAEEVTSSDSLNQHLDHAYKAWINDSYWMFMPYKLKDSGVTLKYVGAGRTADGESAEIVELTFRNVGVTPENKYDVYIDSNSGLVTQWDFFERYSDTKPRFSNAWTNWKQYGNIMLSDGRGAKRRHSDIAVFDRLPEAVYNSPAEVDLIEIKANQEKDRSQSMMSY